MTRAHVLAQLEQELTRLENRLIGLDLGATLFFAGLALAVVCYGPNWREALFASTPFVACSAIGVRATLRTRRFISQGMTVAPSKPWRLTQDQGRIGMASNDVHFHWSESEVCRVEYLFYDDEAELLGLTGTLRLSLLDGPTVRVADNSTGFHDLFSALEAQFPIERRDLSSSEGTATKGLSKGKEAPREGL